MNFKISLSNEAMKAVKKGMIARDALEGILEKFVSKMDGARATIDSKELKGSWKGYYRIRLGELRVIVKPNFTSNIIEVIRIGTRGEVYKKK